MSAVKHGVGLPPPLWDLLRQDRFKAALDAALSSGPGDYINAVMRVVVDHGSPAAITALRQRLSIAPADASRLALSSLQRMLNGRFPRPNPETKP